MPMAPQVDDDPFGDIQEAPVLKEAQKAEKEVQAPPPAPPPTPEQVKDAKEKEKQAEMILNKLFLNGRIVKVSIGCPEFRKKLTAKDLNKKKEDVPEEIISLGQKRLIKKSALSEIKALQSKAYALIDTHSHESWIPQLRFMKDATAEKIQKELEVMKIQYLKLAKKFIEDYPALKEETLKQFPEWAEKLKPFYPSAERVKKAFYFEMSGFDKWRLTIMKKEGEVLGEAKVAIEQSLMGKLNDFLKSSVLDARTQFIEQLTFVKEKLDAGEKVNAKTIQKVHDMIEEAKSKDITGDQDFFKMLEDFKKKFTPEAAKEKNFKAEVEKDLNSILEAAQDEKAAEKSADEYVHRSILI